MIITKFIFKILMNTKLMVFTKRMMNKFVDYIIGLLNGDKLAKLSSLYKLIVLFSPIILINIPFVYLKRKYLFSDLGMCIGLILSGLWVFIAPLLISNFRIKYKNRFWVKYMNSLGHEKNTLKQFICIKTKIEKYYDNIMVTVFVIWLIVAIIALINGIDKLKVIGILSFSDLYLYVFLIEVIYALFLTSIGLSETLIMIITIYIVKQELPIPFDITNKDGVGGYSMILSYCIPTTLHISSGIMFIPVLIEFVSDASTLVLIFIVILIVIFSVFVLLSISLPIYSGYKMAEEKKGDIVQEKIHIYVTALEECKRSPSIENKVICEVLEMNLKLVEEKPTFPFTIKIIITTIFTTLSPIVTFIFTSIFKADMRANLIKIVKEIF